MLTFTSFSGIHNTQPPERLDKSALTQAMNVDIGLSGEVRRRSGYALQSADCHKNLWNAAGFQLATINGELVAFDAAGRRTVSPVLGSTSRVWYCNLPDGRTVFSNGHISGVTDGKNTTDWGVPTPSRMGYLTPVSGGLHKGLYRCEITYARLSDGLEGAPGEAVQAEVTDGGILVTDLPVRSGYGINVYLSGHGGGECFLAGTASGPAFSYLGKNEDLVLPCRTMDEAPMPAGVLLSFWRGRALVARGSTLYASQPHRWESHLPARDFKHFPAPITLVQPVSGGIFVGTEQALHFLEGAQFDSLAVSRTLPGRVVRGSGCAVPGEWLKRGDSVATGESMVCIAGGALTAGFADGSTIQMQQYRTDAREVATAFRIVDGVPQYLAAAAQ